jgi:purine-binding chemotaxis protein CheW
MRARSPGPQAEGAWFELARRAARHGVGREGAPALPVGSSPTASSLALPASYSLAGSPGGAGPGPVHAQRLVVFRLDGAPYALPVERVREILRLRPITPIPRLPAAVRGVISLRGQVIQVIDLRARLALPPGEQGRASEARSEPQASEGLQGWEARSEVDRRARIVVAHDGDGRVAGILVDAVEEVATVGEEAFRGAPGGQSWAVEGLCRLRGRFVSVVDLDRVMALDAGV